ncbi:MAG TPA: hypothetical protein VHW44_10500 [Pseudonocardiaceae bacterium]|nr:hypothetical protein [Pseudonocardiaceae bacterium]
MTTPNTGLRARVKHAYLAKLDETQRSVLVAWGAFTGTFGVTRAITFSLHRAGAGGSGGIVIAGRHIHHYNFGIALLAAVGAVAVRGDGRNRLHPVVSSAYGSGIALIVDELALLLDLKDVYWAKDGRRSVDVAVGLIGLVGMYLAGEEFWRAAGHEVAASARRTS